ncbi:hypothetical protein JL722_12730 [Aureococcus anophagefferens]|nr:hypothetical protein JL722_12730 [Aureococcus anophagefferens]
MNGTNFIKQGIEVVSEAIQADKDEDYERALQLYKRALEVFMTGVKYEKNPAARATILQRVDGYMKRAEDLKDVLEKQRQAKANPQGSAGTGTKDKNDKEGDDDETSKLKGQLASAIVTEKPNVAWADVAGLEGAKDALKEAVILPRKFPQLFVGKRQPWRGILLYGPPGTGKSFLAKAVATEADAQFFAVSSSDLVSKWQGESERLVKNLFEMARHEEHAIIFIDEIDSMCGSRSEGESDATRRIKTEFLVQMQGVSTRKDGLLCDGFSGSDLSVMVREALMEPLRTCQSAKQFQPVECPGPDGAAQTMLVPCTAYPSCAYCPINVSTKTVDLADCLKCGAKRMTLYDVPSEQLKVPDVAVEDFEHIVNKSRKTVAEA